MNLVNFAGFFQVLTEVSGSGADRVGYLLSKCRHFPGVLAFNHDPNDRLGARCPQHYAATITQLLLDSTDSCLN
jgi:hypothetical protein